MHNLEGATFLEHTVSKLGREEIVSHGAEAEYHNATVTTQV